MSLARTLLANGAGLLLLPVPTLAQPVLHDPPPRDLVSVPAPLARPPEPGSYFDLATGALVEIHAPVSPVYIPPGGVLPHGTLPDPPREVGRPMRPGVTPWIPDGTGYWPPAVEDQAGDGQRANPLMQGFEGPGYNGLTPPDPDLARGYDYQVAVTNDDFAVYDSCGVEVFHSDINDFVGNPDFLYDCKVIFDPWAGRWVMMYHLKESSPQQSELYIIVTEDSDPFGLTGAWWYRFPTLQDAGTDDASWADYFDLGYSNQQLYASGNMFRFAGGFRWGRIVVFNKAEVYDGVGAHWLSFSGLTNADGSTTETPRSAKMQTSWSEGGLNMDGVFINSRWGGGSKVTLWKLRDAFGANTLNRTDISVGNYTTPPDAVQPNGDLLDTIDTRLMPAVITNDNYGQNGVELFTGLTTEHNGQASCLLYKFDPIANALEWEHVFWGTDRDYWFPSPAADYSGSAFWVFSRCSRDLGEYASVRFVEIDRGVFTNSSTGIYTGTGNYGGFRWGDYFGGEMDWGDYSANFSLPGRPSKVWLYGEYAKSGSWGTRAGASSVFAQGDLSGVTPAGTWVITGPQGGPFAPSSQVYTLESAAGDTGVAFDLVSLPSWLTASRTYGQLWTDTTVTLSVNANANALGEGVYDDTFSFRDRFAGGSTYSRAVRLIVEEECYADYNGDGVVDTRDVLAFLNDWARHSSQADCDGNGVVDTRDVLCFLNLWTGGC